jgi:predicted secreted Zn-dependent protease
MKRFLVLILVSFSLYLAFYIGVGGRFSIQQSSGYRLTEVKNPLAKVNFTNQQYSIAGSSQAELSRQIRQFGPVDDSGRRYAGYTKWHLDWGVSHLLNTTGCHIETANVTLAITMTLPKWEIPKEVSPSLISKWNSYYLNLTEHENSHYKFAVDGANQLAAELSKVETYADCTILEKTVESLGQDTVSRIRASDSEYDLRTDHGKREGLSEF